MLTNSIIIVLTLAIITTVSIFSLRNVMYKENSVIYDVMIDETYTSIREEFNAAEDFVLHVCTSWNLINLLNEGIPDRQTLKEAITTISYGNEYESVVVLPVKGQDVYVIDEETGEWDRQSNVLQYYPHEYEFEWHFRPDNKPCYRVMKAMHSQKGSNEVIAIVYVDVALTSLADKIYGFASTSDFDANMFLLDENNKYLIPYHLKGNMELGDIEDEMKGVDYSISNDTLLSTRVFPKNGWKIATTVKQTILYKLSDSDLIYVYVGSAALAVLALIITNIITKKVTKPILELSENMQNTSTSDHYEPLPLPDNYTGEVKILYDSYNHLVDEVNQSITNIQEISKKEQENQFMLLQAQINPHFLYNTLNTISWLAQNNQSEEIQKMVVAMVKLFRTSLNNGKPMVTVDQEMDNVYSYLKIMQYRYPNSYTIEMDIAKQTKDLIVIKQILQPLAENALMHGFIETQRDGVIKIRSFIKDSCLVLELSNSGSEIDLELVNKLLNNDPGLSSKHYGIRNVNDRLKQYYGDNSGLNYRVQDGITIVSICLPLSKVKEQYYG